jgi:hypothetical protein
LGSKAPIAITAWRIEVLLSQAWSTRRSHTFEANKPVNWLVVWVLNTWKYLACCWLLNNDRHGERDTAVEEDCIAGTTGTNFTLRWIALSVASSYSSQPKPNLRQRWQLGRVSSHLTFRILNPTILISLGYICIAENE